MSASPPPSADPWLAGFTLGDWEVDVGGNRLQRGQEVRPLRHKAMELLTLLARHAGQTVTRETIVDAVWAGNRFVAPKAINTAVWTIRQALGDDPEAPRYLETIAKKGYRLIAPVTLVQPATPAAPAGSGLDGKTGAAPAVTQPSRSSLDRRLAIAAALLVVAAAGLAWWLLPGVGTTKPPPPVAGASPGHPETLTQEPGVEYVGALSPDGTLLAFAWWRSRGVGELYLRRLDSPKSPPQPIAGAHGDVNGMAWAPDGRSLAVTAWRGDGRCTLWLQALPAAATSPPPRELAECAGLNTPIVAWAGPRIVFSAERDGAGGLFAIAADGSGLQRLSTAAPSALADHQPAASPDGRHIAFVRQDPADGTRDLYELALGQPGQEPVRLSTLKLHTVHGLAYAADGRDLVFSTTRQDTRVLMRWERESGRVMPLGLEGSAPVRAADGSLVYSLIRTHVSIARLAFRGSPVRTIQSVTSDRAPQPDPSGRHLAFVSRRSGAPELWVAAADGSGARALTSLGGLVESPAWSPRGDRLAFIGPCGPGKRFGLCVVRDDGAGLMPLSADAASYSAPAWHPQRDEVWVTSERSGAAQLWRFAAAGGEGRVEATERPPAGAVQWLADGSGFVYRPRGENQLRWRSVSGPRAGSERPIDVAATGEELIDWRLGPGSITTLTRSDRERWRRVDLTSGRRQALGEHALGSFPERARFALAGDDAVWVEVANTHVADLMRLR